MKPTRRSKLYTKAGDKGMTSLYDGSRVCKTDLTIETLGNLDLLNSQIGLAVETCTKEIVSKDPDSVEQKTLLVGTLKQVQYHLMHIGSSIATPRNSTLATSQKLDITYFGNENVDNLELWIDKIDSQVDPLKNFILPGGGLGSANLHLCRASCRQTELCVLKLKSIKSDSVQETIAIYLNRLSDLLFACARLACKLSGHTDSIWSRND